MRIEYFDNKKIFITIFEDWFWALERNTYLPEPSYESHPPSVLLDEKTIFFPQYQKGGIDFSGFAGCTYDLRNISELLNDPTGRKLLDATNFIFNIKTFVAEEHPSITEPIKSLWTNYYLLKSGFQFYIVPGLKVYCKPDTTELSEYEISMSESIRAMILMESEVLNNKK